MSDSCQDDRYDLNIDDFRGNKCKLLYTDEYTEIL